MTAKSGSGALPIHTAKANDTIWHWYVVLLVKCGNAIPEIWFATLAANVRFVHTVFRPKMPKVLGCTKHQTFGAVRGFWS